MQNDLRSKLRHRSGQARVGVSFFPEGQEVALDEEMDRNDLYCTQTWRLSSHR